MYIPEGDWPYLENVQQYKHRYIDLTNTSWYSCSTYYWVWWYNIDVICYWIGIYRITMIREREREREREISDRLAVIFTLNRLKLKYIRKTWRLSDAVNRRRDHTIENTMVNRKRTNWQTLYRKLKTERHEPH